MYGRAFESTFTGSMVGSGAKVFSVWFYVCSHMRSKDFTVELNPVVLAALIGESVESIREAIDFLCSPDPNSRSIEEEGRRLVKEGSFLYRVVNGKKYKEMRDEDERREYMKFYMRDVREKEKKNVNNANSKHVLDCSEQSLGNVAESQPKLAQAVSISSKHKANAEAVSPDGDLFGDKAAEKKKTINEVSKKPKKKPPSWVYWKKKPDDYWIDFVRIFKKANARLQGKDIGILHRVACLYSEVEFWYMLKVYGKLRENNPCSPADFELRRDDCNAKMYTLPDYDESKLFPPETKPCEPIQAPTLPPKSNPPCESTKNSESTVAT